MIFCAAAPIPTYDDSHKIPRLFFIRRGRIRSSRYVKRGGGWEVGKFEYMPQLDTVSHGKDYFKRALNSPYIVGRGR